MTSLLALTSYPKLQVSEKMCRFVRIRCWYIYDDRDRVIVVVIEHRNFCKEILLANAMNMKFHDGNLLQIMTTLTAVSFIWIICSKWSRTATVARSEGQAGLFLMVLICVFFFRECVFFYWWMYVLLQVALLVMTLAFCTSKFKPFRCPWYPWTAQEPSWPPGTSWRPRQVPWDLL